jgi:hypothetical protein
MSSGVLSQKREVKHLGELLRGENEQSKVLATIYRGAFEQIRSLWGWRVILNCCIVR